MSNRLARIPGARIGVRYLYTSLGFWVVFNLGILLWYPHFRVFYFREPYILALTHLAALGWLTTGLMGVLYATMPATLGVRSNTLRMARAQYWLQVVGVAGLALTMSLVPQARGRVIFGVLTLVALVIFAHTVATTVGRGRHWRLPEAHFVMAAFYLAITGLIGMSYVFYLNSGSVPQTMVFLKVHAHFAGIGWLALTTIGLTYQLLPLEVGADAPPQRWGLAASVLINLVFWGVFFGYAYDWPALRMASAALAVAGLACHTMQVEVMARLAPPATPVSSLPYTRASCVFGGVAALLALLLTTGAAGTDFAAEYAYAYVGGVGWFGLYVVGQAAWLLPLLLRDDADESTTQPQAMHLEFLGQVAGTGLVAAGLLTGLSWLVAGGAALSLAASLMMIVRSVRLCWAPPAMTKR